MTPERKKLIETMARAYINATEATDVTEYGWEETIHGLQAALRAAEDKLNVIVVPNEATEEMTMAYAKSTSEEHFIEDHLNAAIAASPYRRGRMTDQKLRRAACEILRRDRPLSAAFREQVAAMLEVDEAENKRLRNVVEKAWALELHRRKHNGSITLGLIVDLSEALEEEALKETDDD